MAADSDDWTSGTVFTLYLHTRLSVPQGLGSWDWAIARFPSGPLPLSRLWRRLASPGAATKKKIGVLLSVVCRPPGFESGCQALG